MSDTTTLPASIQVAQRVGEVAAGRPADDLERAIAQLAETPIESELDRGARQALTWLLTAVAMAEAVPCAGAARPASRGGELSGDHVQPRRSRTAPRPGPTIRAPRASASQLVL